MHVHTCSTVTVGALLLAWLLQSQPVWSLLATFVSITAGILSIIKFFKDRNG